MQDIYTSLAINMAIIFIFGVQLNIYTHLLIDILNNLKESVDILHLFLLMSIIFLSLFSVAFSSLNAALICIVCCLTHSLIVMGTLLSTLIILNKENQGNKQEIKKEEEEQKEKEEQKEEKTIVS